ncbi:PREDICTED: uncharacterized protein LOC105365021 [Ceratosolen solmsi marchali]|uniref:Uncharacterized protein LOC105365021 n=1 Tax=Ceratosolen solmsi marchali TaxID=326594 RepID=A0AAJ6YNM1_9HYME|nr:PREDICTED: uncharacterized protein LOC105365021 [Ceratosolen solmsi marchali]
MAKCDPARCEETCKEQCFFLLELYVCQIRSQRLAKLNEMFFVPTTVAFKFLDFDWDDSLQLTPVDPMFEPQPGTAANIEPFYSGRSVLFALDQDSVVDMCKEFRIVLNVFKKMPQDIKPDVLVGYTEIDMSIHFAALRKEIIDSSRYAGANLSNPSKTFQGELPLAFGNTISGSICILSRISGCGQTIVTELQSPDINSTSTSSFIVKANDQNQCTTPLNYKCRVLDHTSCDLDVLEESGTAAKEKKDCIVCKPPKLPCSPCRIGSGARISASPAREINKCEKSTGQEETNNNCKPIQTSRGPKEPCGKAVVLKVSGLTDASNDSNDNGRQACVTVATEKEAATAEDLRDPDHDIFILRIGKKGIVGAGEKSDIQLEMRTPKGPERRPPLRLETREMQTEEDTNEKKVATKSKKKK